MSSPFERIEAVGAVATAVGALLAAWQLRLSKNQAMTQFEDQLARDYRELSKQIPLEAFFGAKVESTDVNAQLALYHYFDLCNEQVFLRQQGRISRETWINWRGGIASNFRLPAFDDVWKRVKHDTNSFAELRRLEKEEFKSDPEDWGKEPIKWEPCSPPEREEPPDAATERIGAVPVHPLPHHQP